MKTKLSSDGLQSLCKTLTPSNQAILKLFPGERPERQPVSTAYEGAHLFHPGRIRDYEKEAKKAFEQKVKNPQSLGKIFGIKDPGLRKKVFERVKAKLKADAVEDYRIDFEDGFGVRPDGEEDAAAVKAGVDVALALKAGALSPYLGIRVKTLSEDLKFRSLRTVDLFLTALLENSGGTMPSGFVLTLSKVTHVDQVKVASQFLTQFERSAGLKDREIPVEIMVESPQTVLGPDGRVILLEMVNAAEGRFRGAHIGTYDFTASIGITANNQVMDHLSLDFLKHLTQIALSGTGAWLSDGSTNLLPIGPKVVEGWKLSFQHIRHSLKGGYYQGWELNPAQLPVRYVALHSFFLEAWPKASVRLSNFLNRATEAAQKGVVFDDVATGQALMTILLRGMSCGALDLKDALSTGLTEEELKLRSFKKIWQSRSR